MKGWYLLIFFKKGNKGYLPGGKGNTLIYKKMIMEMNEIPKQVKKRKIQKKHSSKKSKKSKIQDSSDSESGHDIEEKDLVESDGSISIGFDDEDTQIVN